MKAQRRFRAGVLRCAGSALVVPALGGCMAMTVAGAAVSVGARAVGVAADVTVGAAKLTGKAPTPAELASAGRA